MRQSQRIPTKPPGTLCQYFTIATSSLSRGDAYHPVIDTGGGAAALINISLAAPSVWSAIATFDAMFCSTEYVLALTTTGSPSVADQLSGFIARKYSNDATPLAGSKICVTALTAGRIRVAEARCA
ncbi:hypothetical protein PCAR4_750015 [Paraburkholderia caribensis]|nr:hypothetical protein PCAR4_750015 [Paraburkholderia caribensis]